MFKIIFTIVFLCCVENFQIHSETILITIPPLLDNKLPTLSLNQLNDKPIIGILTQEIAPNDNKYDFQKENDQRSYIAASYIKYVEGAGARALPIW